MAAVRALLRRSNRPTGFPTSRRVVRIPKCLLRNTGSQYEAGRTETNARNRLLPGQHRTSRATAAPGSKHKRLPSRPGCPSRLGPRGHAPRRQPAARACGDVTRSETLRDLAAGHADVVVAKLDQLAVGDGLRGHHGTAKAERWSVVVLDLAVDTTTTNGELIANIDLARAVGAAPDRRPDPRGTRCGEGSRDQAWPAPQRGRIRCASSASCATRAGRGGHCRQPRPRGHRHGPGWTLARCDGAEDSPTRRHRTVTRIRPTRRGLCHDPAMGIFFQRRSASPRTPT